MFVRTAIMKKIVLTPVGLVFPKSASAVTKEFPLSVIMHTNTHSPKTVMRKFLLIESTVVGIKHYFRLKNPYLTLFDSPQQLFLEKNTITHTD